MWSSSMGWTPSSIASSPPDTTVSGVRSSCVTSASRARRSSRDRSRRSAMALNDVARLRTGRGPRARTLTPGSPSARRWDAAARSASGRIADAEHADAREDREDHDDQHGTRRQRGWRGAWCQRTPQDGSGDPRRERGDRPDEQDQRQRRSSRRSRSGAASVAASRRRPQPRPAHGGSVATRSAQGPSPGQWPQPPREAGERRRSRVQVRVRERVSDAVHGPDVAGRTRIGLQLAAEVADVAVDRPLVRLEREAVYGVQELRARPDAPGLARQRRQQLELGREGDTRRGRRDPPAGEVELEVAGPIRSFGSAAARRCGAGRPGRARRAPWG